MPTVWVTRTEPGARDEADQLRRAAFQPLLAPVLTIERLRPPEPELAAVASARYAIFLSGHAVRCAPAALFPRLQRAELLAVGAGTQRALAEKGHTARVPADERSEGLLALLNVTRGDRVLLVAGEDGRTLLAEALAEAGCLVQKLAVYRRRSAGELPASPTAIDAVLVASGDGFRVFAQLWCAADGSRQLPVIVPSERVAAVVREGGFAAVHVADSARPEAMVACLAEVFQ